LSLFLFLISLKSNVNFLGLMTSTSIQEFQFPAVENEHFPYCGVGIFLFPRQHLVEKFVTELIDNGKYSYFRGPKGIGKTVLLYLVGRELQRRGEKVFHINHAGVLRSLDTDDFTFLESQYATEGKKVYLMIDEVQNNRRDSNWQYLLEESKKIVTIGFGIPPLDGDAPYFREKYPFSYLLLTNKDINAELVQAFKNHFLASNTLGIPDDKIEVVLLRLLSYTGGHIFPFVKLAEYIFTQHPEKVVDGTFASVYRSSSFAEKEVYELIRNRCFELPYLTKQAVHELLEKSYSRYPDTGNLYKSGYWNEEKYWFLSDMFLSFYFATVEKVEGSAIMDDSNPIEGMLCCALRGVTTSSFKKPDGWDFKDETWIGSYFTAKLSQIEGLFVTFESQVVTRTDSEVGGDSTPKVGAYVSEGSFDRYIEFIRNGNNIKEHFDRFESVEGDYKADKDNYIILDFELVEARPNTFPESCEKYKNNYYCFVLNTNTLYRGGVVVRNNVSKSLVSSGEETLR